jgi:hypothetical protein
MSGSSMNARVGSLSPCLVLSSSSSSLTAAISSAVSGPPEPFALSGPRMNACAMDGGSSAAAMRRLARRGQLERTWIGPESADRAASAIEVSQRASIVNAFLAETAANGHVNVMSRSVSGAQQARPGDARLRMTLAPHCRRRALVEKEPRLRREELRLREGEAPCPTTPVTESLTE